MLYGVLGIVFLITLGALVYRLRSRKANEDLPTTWKVIYIVHQNGEQVDDSIWPDLESLDDCREMVSSTSQQLAAQGFEMVYARAEGPEGQQEILLDTRK